MKRKACIVFLLFITTFCLWFAVGCKEEVKEVNLVLLVEFSDTENPFSQSDKSILDEVFISGENSLKNFIYKNSNGKKTVESQILEVVKIDKPIDYFMPRYSYDQSEQTYLEINSIGYDNRLFDENGNPSKTGRQSSQRFFREQELLSLSTSSYSGELDNIKIENLTVIPSKLNRYLYNGDIFYPHQAKSFKGDVLDLSAVYHTDGVEGSVEEVKLANKSINSYILIPYAFINNGEEVNFSTVCHEYMHVLGAPDLYSYDKNPISPVGEFDALGGADTKNANLSLSYTRYKMGWLTEGEQILPIKESGTYTLFPTENCLNGVCAYKITTEKSYEKGDCFYIEHRKVEMNNYPDKTASGIIVYRANEENGYISQSGEKTNTWKGNMYGDFETFVFRFWRDFEDVERESVSSGGICYATIADKVGYTSYGNEHGDKNAITYSDGENSKITVTFLKANSDGSIEFSVKIPEDEVCEQVASEGVFSQIGNRNVLYFDSEQKDSVVYYVYTDKKVNNPSASKLIKGRYGEVRKIDSAFKKVDLPKYDGYQKYVYWVYGEDGEYSEVKSHVIKGIKKVNFTVIILIALAVGVGVVTLYTVVAFKVMNKKGKKDGK